MSDATVATAATELDGNSKSSSSPTIQKKSKSTGSIVKKPRIKPVHPPTSEMVNSAINDLKERTGSSLQAIKKYISANYKIDSDKLSPFIKKYLKSAVAGGILIQKKGKGASGSFKLAKPNKSSIKSDKDKSNKVPKTSKKVIGSEKKLNKDKKLTSIVAKKKTPGTTVKKPIAKKLVSSSEKKKTAVAIAKAAKKSGTQKTKTKIPTISKQKPTKASKTPVKKLKTPKPKKATASPKKVATTAKKTISTKKKQ
jgi:phosphopantetheine adenylyltransferase